MVCLKYHGKIDKTLRYDVNVLPFATVTSSICRISSLEKPRKLTMAYENGPSLYCIWKHQNSFSDYLIRSTTSQNISDKKN